MCNKHHVFPKFMKVYCPNKGVIGESVVQRAKRKWLQLERRKIHTKLTDIELKLYDLHLQITKDMSAYDYSEWLKFLEFCDVATIKLVSKYEDKHNQKLHKLIETNLKDKMKNRPSISAVDDYIKNISSITFTENELCLLNKGLNHAVKPLECDIEQTVVDIESALKKKPDWTKATIRNKVKPIVKDMKKIKKNKKSVQDFQTVEELRKKDVFYLKADKGNSLVIMDKSDYESHE